MRYFFIMEHGDAIIERLNQFFKSRNNVEKVLLFGSYARNTQTKRSDIDIIIITETNKRFFDRYDDFNDIYNIVNNHCDLLIYTPSEWENIRQRKFFKNILKEAKEIYVKGR
ncbi:MAG: hypothetical protein Kow00102_09470 [Spirochaetota bacterium]|nr:nucleotidyltransferase domain-containing protein [Spirochaetota bacterium]